jgi:hypothetical protein
MGLGIVFGKKINPKKYFFCWICFLEASIDHDQGMKTLLFILENQLTSNFEKQFYV